jgi:hypothetical protein
MSGEAQGATRRARLVGSLAAAFLLAAPPAAALADNDFYQEPFGVLLTDEPVTDSNTAAGIQDGEPLTPAGTASSAPPGPSRSTPPARISTR